MIEGNAKTLDVRVGPSPDTKDKKTTKKAGLKQSKLPFKPVKKTKKGKDSDASDSGSDVEVNFDSLSPPPAPRQPRRAAAGN